ncbi:excinuclease ABC subunit UvrC [Emcibacter sp. SYSU 3D8]|uniref:excinuclease ABC subunit UvrC n=1 Tax=Emcibacter sp. SYSU 3D8 TaxID=3133969 RepID=UPI0031FF21D5
MTLIPDDEINSDIGNEASESAASPTDAPALSGRALIRTKARKLPAGSGVYRMLDQHGDVMYVGKARNLKARVGQYASGKAHTNRVTRMIGRVHDLIVVTTETESQALLLEAQLIKRYMPPYNVLLRDDKSFPYILIRTDHQWPQIKKHRGAQNLKGHYFGPFASAGAVNSTLNTLQRAFLLRSCSDGVFTARTRPCLLFQIKRCSAPCVGRVTSEEYDALLDDARTFLGGKSQRVQRDLSEQMMQASEAMEFERAAAIRDRIKALASIQGHQGVTAGDLEDADVIAVHQQGAQSCVQVFFLRAGQNWGNRAYFPKHDTTQGLEEVLEAFIGQFYDSRPAPQTILISHDFAERPLMEEALSLKSPRKVSLVVPKRGDKAKMIDLALRNARDALALRMAESASQQLVLSELATVFDLEGPPGRIEAYDNSHISGTNAIGAMIVAGPDGFMRNNYRKFNIKDSRLAPGDDYGMMREVLTRRFGRLVKEDPERSRGQWPDLVLIDGGAGQLAAAEQVLAELGIEDLPLVAIAKGADRNAGRERFFLPGREPFTLDPRSAVMYYLQRIRDEVHRFAIGTHRQKRAGAMKKSQLDEVPGVGPGRKKALLAHFGSARAVAGAALEDLESADGISKAVARKVYDYFHAEG